MSTPNCYCPTLRYSGAIDRSGARGLVSSGRLQVCYDSEVTWETVAGVSVGEPPCWSWSCARAQHSAEQAQAAACPSAVKRRVEVPLPRGSVYVMSGDARDQADRSRAWKHGIKWPAQLEPAPSWNVGRAPSVTLRANKLRSHYCLEHRVRGVWDRRPGRRSPAAGHSMAAAS